MRLPYSRQQVGAEESAALAAAVSGEWLTGGPTLARFEAALAEAVGARYAVAVSSGTAALHVAYRAAGLAAGDRLLTSPLTFVATANAAVHSGAIPAFADVDAHGSLDAEAVRQAVAGGLRARVVVPRRLLGTGPGTCPAAETLYGELLSLPCFPGMEDEDVAYVVAALANALGGGRRRRDQEAHADHAR